MAITDIFRRSDRRRSENSVNHLQTFGAVNFFSQFTSTKKYSDMYLWLIVNRVFRGLQNVRYELDKDLSNRDSDALLAPLLRLFNTQLAPMIWQLWQNGMIVIERTMRGGWYIVPFDKLRFDGKGAVLDHDNVIYSDAYIYLGKSDIAVVRENLNAIDAYKNSDLYLTKTFGAFGILSGRDMGINANDKEELQQSLKMHAGTTEAKDQFIISNSALDFHQIDFKIKDLELKDKVNEEMKALAGYFGVPYDLLPVSGASTYANQEQAVVDFYRNCISPLAEVVLSLGRYVILHERTLINTPSTVLTFTIDNVPELADDRTAAIDYKHKVADLGAKIRDLGLEVPEYIINELKEE